MSETEKQMTTARKKTKKRSTRTPARVLAKDAVDALLDKKGRNIVVMDMREVSGVADFFVICTGDSDLQIRALSESVQERIRERFAERPWHVEGKEHYQWVLMDYVDLVVHVFNHEKRSFYDLERLWGDAPAEEVPEDATADEVGLLQEEQDVRRRSGGAGA